MAQKGENRLPVAALGLFTTVTLLHTGSRGLGCAVVVTFPNCSCFVPVWNGKWNVSSIWEFSKLCQKCGF